MMSKYCLATATLAALVSSAGAQSLLPSVHVATVTNGIQTYTVKPDGGLSFVGTTPSISNAQTMTLSLDGRFLAVAQGTSSTVTEQLQIFGVNSDATLTPLLTANVPDSPLDSTWLPDNRLAVTQTRLSGLNAVRLYDFDPVNNTFAESSTTFTGTFTTKVHYNESLNVLYTSDSSSDVIGAYSVGPTGLTLVENQGTGSGPVNSMSSPDGKVLLATTGAIGANGREIQSYTINGDGSLEFAGLTQSPERYPDQIRFSEDSSLVFVGHNDDENVVSFGVDTAGTLTPTGNIYNVGSTLSQGEMAVLGDLLFVIDESSSGDQRAGLNVVGFDATGAFTQIDFASITGGGRDLTVWRGVPEPATLGAVAAAGLVALRRRTR